MQLFTPEKRDTLAFHIMTKEIYPHSVLLAQYNPSKQVGTCQLNPNCAACLTNLGIIRYTIPNCP